VKLLLPECVWRLHEGSSEWLCESIEKGLYSVDINRLLSLLKEKCLFFPEGGKKELDMSLCQFSILLTCKEELLRIQDKFDLKEEEMQLLVAYLAVYGFLMGEI
jgi:hypothetical protein